MSRNHEHWTRYRRSCRNCGEPTQATPLKLQGYADDLVWVRCRDCGSINRCERVASATQTGSVVVNRE